MDFGLNKRQKIIIASVILTFGLVSTQLVDFNLRFKFLTGLTILAYFISLWALWEGINFLKAAVLLILPTLFVLGLASFYFLLPVRWLTRLPVALIFGLSFYSLLLSQNVFNVASIRTIPLYRAASTAAFLFTLITAFFLFNVIHAFNLLFIWNGLLVFSLGFLLVMQILWSIDMKDRLDIAVIVQSMILSLSLTELSIALSFWPMVTTMWSLTLASVMYVLIGLSSQILRDRVNRRAAVEYLSIGAVIFIVAFLTTSWSG
ncbi:hypothetical protein A3F00_02725 [Candidatus Daviesbacteria bacterium RIFCSPHIGHO2_12_FULL_37_11]|uniref:Uncharacterized protein n=1 Tax=Candidatus Daviesbacteria bacterium RIFCSPHIGHO2_12_FULL_37_11 TaxID=1797777 RepID=A0A1F5KEW7_9BACT|nr:MAG: hypothetical protein A2111_00825 [Candidatus Daviesbacteria bacterium GWA1_38_6]OGE39350.1 MAG: hypothetical protein A3F00_02725 [Candidatus Daviesbacteria bacterium RIFCSPHIGHO2_12_FULL_37_11]OGE45146.1 MAG: hypothetical protein A3B39_01895 [Candidatus Daviesbacteria bacterium RIFCSPLOWO2_01_FULL_37_10]